MLAFLDPAIQIHSAPEVGNPGSFHGHAGWRRWTGQWFDAWDSFEQTVLAVEPAGERCVITEVRQAARGRTAGVELQRTVSYVFEVRDGRAVYLGLYADRASALEAAAAREARAVARGGGSTGPA